MTDPRLLGALGALTKGERLALASAAKQAALLEKKWVKKFQEYIYDLDGTVFRDLCERGHFRRGDIDFLDLVLQHSLDVMAHGFQSAQDKEGEGTRIPRLASRYPEGRIPRSLKALRELYDRWKKKKDLPPRQKAIAEKLKKAYIKRCESVWERYGDDFIKGKVFDRRRVAEVLQAQGDMAKARANTIVQTETTHYYNKARKKIYDRSPDVTHYLFVALRDKATTKWCKTRQGLVYAKGDPLLQEETPPIHWNCRSEILPLTSLNPNHRKLIEDKSRQRRHHRCEPLPAGWKGR